jgi:phosphatidylserine/phosphatidylglycerophosphate/cardiolipin synthase-like enzyme
LRGIDVTLVVPLQMDQLLVHLAQRSYYDELLGSGVRICRYGRRFLHAKHVTIDDRIAWIGSSNLDVRSFALNAEIVVLLYDANVCASLTREQARSAGLGYIVRHFDDIDRQRAGAVSFDDVKRFLRGRGAQLD